MWKRLVWCFLASLVAVGLLACRSPAGDSVKGSPARPEVGGVLRVIGNGAPELRSPSVHVAQQDAGKAAEADIKAQLEGFVSRFVLPDGEPLKDRMARDAKSREAVGKVLSSYKVLDTLYFSDGALDVVVELSLDSLVRAATGEAAKPAAAPAIETILDARQVKGFVPGGAPVLLRKDGTALLEGKGSPVAVSYATSLDAARGLAKEKPVILTLDADALSRGGLVIPASDAERIKKAGLGTVAIVPPIP